MTPRHEIVSAATISKHDKRDFAAQTDDALADCSSFRPLIAERVAVEIWSPRLPIEADKPHKVTA
jgi:hypothetical protein